MQPVLDACAIIAFLRGEDGADIVEAALVDGNCLVHAVNLCEVYKDCLVRGENNLDADKLLSDLYSTGLQCREDMDAEFWKFAAHLKAKYRKISLADCYALSLTSRIGGQLLSSDHHELEPLKDEGICNIAFIR
jgi:PIN domain nuclease of toxin-antitoxin system